MLRHFKWIAACSAVALLTAVGCGDETTNNSTTMASSNEAGAPAVRTAGEGESCQTTSDCNDGLICITNICVEGPSVGEGGDGNVQQPQVLGKIGESCEKRSDCEKGLACVNETCSVENYPLEANGKECVWVECDENADCCTPSNANCGPDTVLGTYQERCKYYSDPATADATLAAQYCANVKFYCECEGWSCNKNVCERACEAEAECGTYNVNNGHNDSHCSGTKCVQCRTVDDCTQEGQNACVGNRCVQCDDDKDCGDGQTCEGNVCTTRECYTDAHCEVFEKCNDAGRCVEDECTTDRECAEYLDSGIAQCVEGECRIPCATDAECNDDVGGSAPYNANLCEDGYCVEAGCESAADCIARNGGSVQSNFICK